MTAVNNVDLDIFRVNYFACSEAQVAGKTTLLRMLAGFEVPTSGAIMIDGADMSTVPPYEPNQYDVQSYALFPHMTVEKNIAFGLLQDKIPKAEISDGFMKF